MARSYGAALVSTRDKTCEMLVYMLEKSYDSLVVILHAIAEHTNQHVCFSTKTKHASTVHACVNFDVYTYVEYTYVITTLYAL